MDRTAWDERYRDRELLWGADPNRFLVPEVDGLEPGRALDLACGEGRNAIWLATRGWDVTAVDFSAVALDRGRAIAERAGVTVDWHEADLLAYDPPAEGFDLVALVYLQVAAPQRQAVLATAAAALAPGGVLLVIAHDRDNLERGVGGPQDPAVLARPDEVAADLVALGLRVDKAEEVLRPVDSDTGPRHAVDHVVRAVRAA